MEVVTYQCPNCGAPLEFNSQTQRWDCKFCLSEFDKSDLDNQNDEQSKAKDEEQQAREDEKKRCYYCPSCGAQIVTDETTAASFCTFCGNPTVLPGRLEEEFRPEELIPFKLDREKAKAALYELCRKKPLLPKDFTDKAHIDKVTGMYVPFWLHDCYVNASLRGTGERVAVWRSGDTEYTKTDVYAIERDGALTYRCIPTDGSKKMDDSMMDALEPFYYNELKEFNMAYLSGYFAQRYDVDWQQCSDRVKKRVEKSSDQQLRNTCTGYMAVQVTSMDADIIKSTHKYVMMPVWMLHTKYRGKDYIFAMNGQTGKMVGDLPLSIPRAFALGGIITAAVTILGTIGGLLLC